MKDIEKEVVDVLTENPENISFEDIQSEQHSPLNQAVIEKDIADTTSSNDWNIWKGGEAQHSNEPEGEHQKAKESFSPIPDSPPEDAPEQDIGNNVADNNFNDSSDQNTTHSTSDSDSESTFELPTATAKQAADTILGMTNNVLAVGGGFFVKIRKHKEFYDFDEIVELIDQQNEKNVKRIQLDKEDKALLKPLIVAILKKKAKKLTPEQQLAGAILSILMKKGQQALEMRAENDILVDRILDIVREEKGYSDQDLEEDISDEDILDAAYEEINGKPDPKHTKEDSIYEEDQMDIASYDDEPEVIEGVIEVADEETKE